MGTFSAHILTWFTLVRPNKKMCVSGYMLLTIRVGRSEYFFYFLQ